MSLEVNATTETRTSGLLSGLRGKTKKDFEQRRTGGRSTRHGSQEPKGGHWARPMDPDCHASTLASAMRGNCLLFWLSLMVLTFTGL